MSVILLLCYNCTVTTAVCCCHHYCVRGKEADSRSWRQSVARQGVEVRTAHGQLLPFCHTVGVNSFRYRCSLLIKGLHPDKPVVVFPNSKVHLIHLICWMSGPSLASLKCAQSTISKHTGDTVRWIRYLPSWWRAWLLWLAAAAWHQERVLTLCILAPGIHGDRFCTITKSKT